LADRSLGATPFSSIRRGAPWTRGAPARVVARSLHRRRHPEM